MMKSVELHRAKLPDLQIVAISRRVTLTDLVLSVMA
jgi:hypothetical protein